MMKMEMTVGHLKHVIDNLPDQMPVFVGCNGDSNFDFETQRPCEGTDTFAIVYEGKLFVTDQNAIACGPGETI